MVSDILNLNKMDDERQDELREDMTDAIWSLNGRIVVVMFLAVFGAIQLHLLSKTGTTQEMETTVNMVYSILGVLFGVYIGLPFLRYGLKYKSERVGKVLLVVISLILGYSVLQVAL